jgi:CHASE3 domain sensor protein
VFRRTKYAYPWIALILILLVTAALWSHWRYREEMRLVDHARAVQETIYDIQTTLADAETGRRGFILTGEPSFLVPVEAAVSRAPEALRRLRELTKDNLAQQSNVRDLKRLVTARAEFLKQTAKLGMANNEEVRAI